MSRLLSNPKTLTIGIAGAVVFVAGLWGGALGNEFGGGFLGSPLAHIQLSAEPISANPIVGSFKITNTMVATWATIVALALISFIGTHRIKEVPGRLQNILEIVLEFFLGLAESVAGPERARRFFPLIMTIFLFVLTANWMGVLPGFGTIGWVESPNDVIKHAEKGGGHADLNKVHLQVFDGDGSIAILPMGSIDSVITAAEYNKSGVTENKRAGLLVPFLRSANTDMNTTLAIALVAMIMIHWWGFRMLGALSHIGKFVNVRGGPIGLFVGILEGISEIARVISFTFRLFGNIFAGEVLLIAMAFLLPLIGLVPFLGLELFVGLIQAFIFSMLTLVFAATATVSHATEEH